MREIFQTQRQFLKTPRRVSIPRPLVRHTCRSKESGILEAEMARQHTPSENLRSIAGAALVWLGLHILFGNLDRAAFQLRDLIGTGAGATLGVLPSVVLVASHAVHAYALDRQAFLLALLRVLVSFWPLLLVIAGIMLLQGVLTDKVKALPTSTRYFNNEDSGCRFRCPSFDT
jgi:hypothetical protein